MKTNFRIYFILLLFLASCAVGTPEATPTLTITPTLTSTSTSTPIPLPTSTVTPAAAGEIKLIPFTVETKGQLMDNQIRVPQWVKEHEGRMITPGDIIDGTDSVEREYPSDRLVTGFWIRDNDDGSKTVCVEIDGQITSLSDLPYKYDTVMLTGAQAMWPDVFSDLASVWDASFDKLLAIKLKMNTVGGELEMVMVTDGDIVNGINKKPNKSNVIANDAGENFKYPVTPLVRNDPDADKAGDLFASPLAGKIAIKDATQIESVGLLMASTDLTDPVQMKALREKLREVWLVAGGSEELSSVHVQK